jgi:hypothetical protein
VPVVEIIVALEKLVVALGKLGPWGLLALLVLALLPVIWVHGVTL